MAAADVVSTTANGSPSEVTKEQQPRKQPPPRPQRDPYFLDACGLSHEDMRRLANGTLEDRARAGVAVDTVSSKDVLKLADMTFVEHASCVLFLSLGVPNGVFSIPILTYLTGRFLLNNNIKLAFSGLAVLLTPLVIFPQKFVPSTLQSWMACQVLKYFSFRFINEVRPTEKAWPGRSDSSSTSTSSSSGDEVETVRRPQILVAPPHGVFPYGNLLAMLVWPMLEGHHFIGLASNAAVRTPIFKQILGSIGVVDASRSTARKALENYPHTIGISTGGVAEVFETNAGAECILLKERIGLVKLAIRTGADLVPCYLYGNTKLLSCWTGEGVPGFRNVLEWLSRKIGFALILFFGRLGLPIPYRVPVLGVKGAPIPTAHLQCEDPTMDQVLEIQKQLIEEMNSLFDRYKSYYEWDHQKLIIK